jgi:hypothetical protein
MASHTVVSSDAAVTDARFDATGWEWVKFKCHGLGAAETATVKVSDGIGGWTELRDIDGNIINFTGSGGTPASRKMFTVDGGEIFQFSYSDPAATVTITAVEGRGINS